jgi:hypothetical protein
VRTVLQVLYLEHSVESLARGGPWLLGTIRRGRSGWRSLSEVESETYGGSARRRLYGCAVTMLYPQKQQAVGTLGSCSFNMAGQKRGPDGLFKQLLLTWSQVMLCPQKLPLKSLLTIIIFFGFPKLNCLELYPKACI